MSDSPTIYIELLAGAVNGELVFGDPDKAKQMLNKYYTTQANAWIGAIKVRTAGLFEKIDRVMAFDCREGWVVINKGGGVQTRMDIAIVANLELGPTSPNFKKGLH